MIAYAAAHMAALHAMKIGGWQVVTTPSHDPAGRPNWVTAATLRSHPRSTVTADARLQGEALARCCEAVGLKETASLLRREMEKVLGAPTLAPPTAAVTL
jgi:hypothetical protein